MFGAAAVVILYVAVGVAEVLLWERRSARVVTAYCVMMTVVCVLTVLLTLGIEPPRLILRTWFAGLLRRLGIRG